MAYEEYFIRIDEKETGHAKSVVTEFLETLQSIGLDGLDMEVDEKQNVVFISVYPDIIKQRLRESGKVVGRPRKLIPVDNETIRSMIQRDGAEMAARQLGVSKKTMYRRLNG